MHNFDHKIRPEYRESISKALHFINQNLSASLSLESLASVANYSPFHFQKIFSEALLESPKQYIIRLRLERAAHYIKLYPTLPISEIASGCGFSSPSIFSRAFKNYYSVTAEVFREMPVEKIVALFKQSKENAQSDLVDHWVKSINNPMERLTDIEITPPPVLKTLNAFQIASVQTTLNHPESISFAFKSLMKWAIPNDMITTNIKYIGIWLDVPFYTSPDKCRYLAGIEVGKEMKSKKGIEVTTINEGKYAQFSLTGNQESTLNHVVALNHRYLPEMGYEIAEIICYEIFDECPAYKPYHTINKTILVPIKIKN